MSRCARGRWLARMPAPVTVSRSLHISVRSDVFDRAIADFAEAYADQSERDYESLLGAIKSGRVVAETGI